VHATNENSSKENKSFLRIDIVMVIEISKPFTSAAEETYTSYSEFSQANCLFACS